MKAGRRTDQTQHVVSISRSFFLGQFKVTQAANSPSAASHVPSTA
jgi:hypothetical protein